MKLLLTAFLLCLAACENGCGDNKKPPTAEVPAP